MSFPQGKGGIERLEITGAGDPSGRGLGFSFQRVPARAPSADKSKAAEKKAAAAAAKQTASVTGTDADLRRLSMEAARVVSSDACHAGSCSCE